MEKVCFWDICFIKDEDIKNFVSWDKLDIEFEYKSDFAITKTIRDFISVSWKIFWLSEKLLSRMILVCDELNNNAIEHWSSENWVNIFRLRLEKHNSEIFFNVEVEDDWKWKWAKNALEMEALRDNKLKEWYSKHFSIRWRGLFLITINIVDKLYFKDSKRWGLIVWVRKNFNTEKID